MDYNNYTNQLNSNQQHVFQLLEDYVVNAPDTIEQKEKKKTIRKYICSKKRKH